MNTQTTTRASALGLAATITLTVLASINFMATSPAPDTLLTSIAGAADQTIVIEAKRQRG
jgi:hypothetical protein